MSDLSSNSAVYEVQEGMDRDLNKQFRVTDTRTDSRVATCYVQSNADLVCAALNAYTADEPPAVDVAPIAKLTVRDGLVQRAGLYAPGLPDGDHDVFPVPLSPKGELRPHVLAEPPKVIRTTDATLNAGLDQLRAIANGQVLKISPLQARLILDYVSHAEPSDTDHCHADPIHCTPECRLKTCDHAWDFNYVPPQCAFGCGATLEALDAPAVTKDDGLWNPFGNDGMRHMENADVIGGATDETTAVREHDDNCSFWSATHNAKCDCGAEGQSDAD